SARRSETHTFIMSPTHRPAIAATARPSTAMRRRISLVFSRAAVAADAKPRPDDHADIRVTGDRLARQHFANRHRSTGSHVAQIVMETRSHRLFDLLPTAWPDRPL